MLVKIEFLVVSEMLIQPGNVSVFHMTYNAVEDVEEQPTLSAMAI